MEGTGRNCSPFPPPFNHSHTHTHMDFPWFKTSLKSLFCTWKHHVQNAFQGLFIAGDNSQRGWGEGWGIKSGTVTPGSEGVCSPPYQLHGGVILFPAPQHHAHLTSGQRGKVGGKEKKGEGAEAPARAPGRSGSPDRSSSPPRTLGHPRRPRPPRPRPGPCRARAAVWGWGGRCPEPGARPPRCPAPVPPPLSPRQPPLLRQIKQLPLRPNARALQRGGRWGRSGEGAGVGAAGLPAPSPARGPLRKAPAHGWAG